MKQDKEEITKRAHKRRRGKGEGKGVYVKDQQHVEN